jgi:hypothetical protein
MTLKGLEVARTYLEVSKNADGWSLPVELAGETYFLPMKNVAEEGALEPKWIAYFDPRRKELMKAGAKEMTRRFVELEADVIVAVQSSKSMDMLELARDLTEMERGSRVDLVVLARGVPGSKEMKRNEEEAVMKTNYSPITAIGKERVMVVSPMNFGVLLHHFLAGHKVVGGDDVYSSGETANAMRKLLRSAYKTACPEGPELQIPLVTVMRECLLGADGTLEISSVNDLVCAVHTPVIKGDLKRAA